MSSNIKLSIVIPCYNEQANIPLILERFNEVIKREDIEIVLVNNGSTDDSAAVLDRLVVDYAFAKVVTVTVNQGYGFGILSGLRQAQGEFLGWTHADMQTDPFDTIKALDIIEQHQSAKNLYLKGLRKKRPLFDQIFTVGMSVFETVYLKAPLWDINAQPNIFHRSFFNDLDNPPHDFSLDLFFLFMAKRKQLTIQRFPVVFPERIHGESSWNHGLAAKWKFIKRTLTFSQQLKKDYL